MNQKGFWARVIFVPLLLAASTWNPGRADEKQAERKRILAETTAAINKLESSSKSEQDLGTAGTANFTVMAAPGKGQLARRVADRAEFLRKEIALAWLGKELETGKPFTIIRLQSTNNADDGLTLVRKNGFHWLWLTTSDERAQGHILAHELTHVVLSARFPEGMPVWANEGIASLADDEARMARRRHLLQGFASNGFPGLRSVLDKRSIPATDETSYAVSISLVEFFLSRGDRQTLLRFVAEGRRLGWDAALRETYGITDVNQLQQQWQTWVAAQFRSVPAAAQRSGGNPS